MDKPSQEPFPELEEFVPRPSESALDNPSNAIQAMDREIHEWYRFVLSYPPHLVRHYLSEFDLPDSSTVLDPFCGTGTTLVEARLAGLKAWGIEAHPFSRFVSSVKLQWDIDPDEFLKNAQVAAEGTRRRLQSHGIDDLRTYVGDPDDLDLPCLDEERERLLIKNSISPIPLRKTLILIEEMSKLRGEDYFPHLRLALAKALVTSIGNLRFGPEVGVGKIKKDSPVVAPWINEVGTITNDLKSLSKRDYPEADVKLADAREIAGLLPENSVDAVITSPPYPNEKDYTRTTRLESVLLGFIKDRMELRKWKKELVRSNTRGVYKADTDDQWIDDFPEITNLAERIEERRKEMGKTSGFERTYHRVTLLYFGGMMRHLSGLRRSLSPGARLAYVVGDQASYLQVMIRTGSLLAKIADSLGYEVENIDLFRTRFATATSEELREEIVLLRWPGRETRT